MEYRITDHQVSGGLAMLRLWCNGKLIDSVSYGINSDYEYRVAMRELLTRNGLSIWLTNSY